MHVVTVDNQSAPARRIVQRSADHPGLAAGERGHRVVQVGEAADAGIERRAGGGVVGAGVAGHHQHAGVSEAADGRRRHAFGRQREHHLAAARRRDQRQVFFIKRAEQRAVVDALARAGEERTFQVDAQDARHALLDRRVHRFQRLAHGFARVGDQGGQQAGGAEGAMRGGDAAQGLHRGIVVEQQPAAAVDLHVDEAGQQQFAA